MNTELIKSWIRENKPRGDLKLAVAANVSLSTIHKIIHQERSPGIEVAKKLARVLGVDLNTLCEDDDTGPEAA